MGTGSSRSYLNNQFKLCTPSGLRPASDEIAEELSATSLQYVVRAWSGDDLGP